jgi:Fur family ferric uptake transcriptional regulator
MKDFSEKAGLLCRKKGKRMTRERLGLFEGIAKQKGHFSVDELIVRLKRRGCKVSRDTMYRNLPLLMEAGLLRQSFQSGRGTFYEAAGGRVHHDHLICSRCGKIIEFVNERIEKFQDAIARRKHFRLQSHTLQLVGVCAKCQD